ncbi:lytic transglycosylase domain-containing protein [Nocardioides sp.]|uniref:lytic transglycosylase domain-containing protein n=1 Tax=Nocardioides sp. TaxID=35761 RepID=UPI00271F2EF4|nr:lytic murein transglycosylase [Nocardioides sp.]MDO9455483.1 lytic murein transglycosylase [Nocardioides sp.]
MTLSASRFGRMQKAVAIVPLALLSAAWTASLTSAATPTTNVSAATAEPGGLLPDGSSVPAQAIEAPASVSDAGGLTGSVGGVEGNTEQILATSSTNGIPSAALAAYQRAETVINAADKSCHLNWQLVAAIGRVESNHGRFGGNVLDADGVAQPGILGLPLDGTKNTALIRDTDAGQYDGDSRFDRAAGPMQFIPSTWSVVGVDADNDGVRNPQDIDDAALATAVYLCSGDDDLATLKGQRASVYRYNHSDSYVDLVLSVMDAYLDGDFMSVPNGTVEAGFLSPDPTYNPGPTRGNGGPRGNNGGSTSGQQVDPEDSPAEEPAEEPTDEPTTPPTGGGGGGPQLPLPPITVPALPTTNVDPVDDVLTLAQAIVQCTLDGKIDNILRTDDPFDLCVKDYTTP